MRLDLRIEADIAQAFGAAVQAFGDIDVLVNNAGRALIKPAVDVTWADWDDVIAINLKGAFFLSRAFAAHCIARKRPGCIVSLASTHGLTGIAGRSVYGISKGGIIQMTRMLAIEWAANNIRVNAIAPATALTESRQKILNAQMRETHAGPHSERQIHHAGGGRRRGGISGERGRGLDHRPHAALGRRAGSELAHDPEK